MNRTTKALILSGLMLLSTSALAQVSSLTLRFGGGCTTENDDGGCTIKVRGSGSDVSGQQVVLEKNFRNSDSDNNDDDDDDDDDDNGDNNSSAGTDFEHFGRPRSLGSTGTAKWRFINDSDPDTCYRAAWNNGEVHSNVLCIGEGNPGSGSSSSSSNGS